MRTWIVLVILAFGCGGKKDDNHDKGSAASKVQPTARATAFWKWFSDNAPAMLADKDVQGTMQKIGAELRKIDEGVFAELGVGDKQRTLVITADGKKALFPIVDEIYAARPTLPGWTIVAYRQRAKPGDAALTIDMGGKKISPSDVKFVATPGTGKLDIKVFIPGFTNADEMGQIGFLMLDHTVGEYDMETKIGVIDFAGLDKAPKSAQPLPELAAAVDAFH